MKSVLDRYILVASISESRTYYLFTPDAREVVFKTHWNQFQINSLTSRKASHAEVVVANHLYKLNQIVQ